MKRMLLIAAFALMAAPFAPAKAANCAADPKAHIKQAEQALKAQNATLSKKKKQNAAQAINAAKMANKFGNAQTACDSLERANVVLRLGR